jgi:hypothetical protein
MQACSGSSALVIRAALYLFLTLLLKPATIEWAKAIGKSNFRTKVNTQERLLLTEKSMLGLDKMLRCPICVICVNVIRRCSYDQTGEKIWQAKKEDGQMRIGNFSKIITRR